jgi:hypothetical protein
MEDGPSGHSQETSGFRMYLKRKEVQFMSYPHVGIDGYLVVRQSQMGATTTLFGCQTVPIGRDKCVIRHMSLFVQMVAAAVHTL